MQRLSCGPRHLTVGRAHRIQNGLGLAAFASSLARRLAYKAVGVAQQLRHILRMGHHGFLVLGLHMG